MTPIMKYKCTKCNKTSYLSITETGLKVHVDAIECECGAWLQ